MHGWHNTCRHRGSRLCLEEQGTAHRLVCPYHQWVYELDGRLLHARQMPAGFDTGSYNLLPVATEIVCGMVYICLAETPPDSARFRAAVTPFIAPHAPDRTKVAHVSTMVELANWKLVIDNTRECYHCAGSHPELLATLVEFALPNDPLAVGRFAGLMQRQAARWNALGLPHRSVEGGDAFRCIRNWSAWGAGLSMTIEAS